MITLKGIFGATADRAINRKALREELLARYEVAAKEGPGMDFTCRRCLKRCDIEEGSDFLAGLCDVCSNEVEDRFLRGAR